MIHRAALSRRWLWLAALLVCGCGAPKFAADGRVAAPAPLRVAAASDLQAGLPALASRFTDETQIEVSPTFGASGQLAEQIKAVPPSTSSSPPTRRSSKTWPPAGSSGPSRSEPMRGALVLVVHRDAAEAIRSLGDLTKPEVKRIALANPAFAPYGAAGKQALERSGVWSTVSSKVVPSETVRQALQFVQSGNAEAGLVASAIAGVPEVRVFEVNPDLYDPIIQSLGVVARSAAPRTPKPSPASSWVTRGRPSCYNPVSGNSDPLREPP